jgi:hypothetical protein
MRLSTAAVPRTTAMNRDAALGIAWSATLPGSDPRDNLLEIRRILQPGAYAYITIHDKQSLRLLFYDVDYLIAHGSAVTEVRSVARPHTTIKRLSSSKKAMWTRWVEANLEIRRAGACAACACGYSFPMLVSGTRLAYLTDLMLAAALAIAAYARLPAIWCKAAERRTYTMLVSEAIAFTHV